MTQPVDDVEKLARELAEAMYRPSFSVASEMTRQKQVQSTIELFTPILTTHFSARDAEVQRLREAATAAVIVLKSASDASGNLGRHATSRLQREVADKLNAALHPNHQEPSE